MVTINSHDNNDSTNIMPESNFPTNIENDDTTIQIEKQNHSHFALDKNTTRIFQSSRPSNADVVHPQNLPFVPDSNAYLNLSYNQYQNQYMPGQYLTPRQHSIHESLSDHNSQPSLQNSSASMTPQHINSFGSPPNTIGDQNHNRLDTENEFKVETNTDTEYIQDIFATVSPIITSHINADFCSTKDELRGSLYKDSYLKLQHNDNSYNLNDYDFSRYQPTVEDTNFHLGSSTSSDNEDQTAFQNSKIDYLKHLKSMNHENSLQFQNVITSPAEHLPNAILNIQKFKKLQRQPSLLIDKNTWLMLPGKMGLQEESDFNFSLVWSKAYAKRFWTAVFNTAVEVDVYWAFFMDRSLNIILKACNSVLQLAPSLINQEPKSFVENINRTTFTENDLEILTKKSYTYYGILIRQLRHAINHVHIEFSAKISLFAAWSSFLHLHASVETLSLMYNGTSSLFTKIANEAKTINDISPSIKVAIHVLNFSCMISQVPDYKFNIIEEIYEDLLDFKQFINRNQALTTANNEMVLQKFLQLEHFLEDLVHNVYPKIQYVDNFYKSKYNLNKDTSDITFVSPTMLFELMVNWFNVFSSESMSVGSSLTALKRTFYLFFTATGRALAQVFSPIQSVLLIEPINVFAPIIEFDASIYQLDKLKVTKPQFDYLFALSTKLIRVIKFFEFRCETLAYYFSLQQFWNKEQSSSYLECVKAEHDLNYVSDVDVLRIIPKKITTNEVMITNFNKETIIDQSNFPLWDQIASLINDPNLKSEYLKEIQHQRLKQQSKPKSSQTVPVVQNSFDYSNGLFSHDFNPKRALSTYRESQKGNLEQLRNMPLEELRLRITNIDISRRQVSKAVRKNFEKQVN
jgi:hypothetical protein